MNIKLLTIEQVKKMAENNDNRDLAYLTDDSYSEPDFFTAKDLLEHIEIMISAYHKNVETLLKGIENPIKITLDESRQEFLNRVGICLKTEYEILQKSIEA